jgi:hypothetical protein
MKLSIMAFLSRQTLPLLIKLEKTAGKLGLTIKSQTEMLRKGDLSGYGN